MILTFTPNPARDRTVTLPGMLARGAVNRLATVHEEAGGKGLNVAGVLAAAGTPASAVIPVADHDPLAKLLTTEQLPGLQVIRIPVPAPTRVNLAITEPDGTTTKLNEPGSALSRPEITAIEQALLELARAEPPDWVALCGSLPPGAPADWYVRLLKLLRPTGVKIAIDTSDAPLQAVAAALPQAAPHLLKPNLAELAQLSGVDADHLAAETAAGKLQSVANAAQMLVTQGVETVLASLGKAGALLATSTGTWYAPAAPASVVSTVGAGDTALAGYLHAAVSGNSAPTCLRTAVAYGAGAVSQPGTGNPARAVSRARELLNSASLRVELLTGKEVS